MRAWLAALLAASAGCSALLGIGEPGAGEADGGVIEADAPSPDADHDGGRPADAGPPLFAAPVPIVTGVEPRGVAIADLDLDGEVDVVVANHGSDDLSLLLGFGDGSFMPKQDLPAGAGPDGVAVGAFDGDAHPDLVVQPQEGTQLRVFRADALTAGVYAGFDGHEVISAGDTLRQHPLVVDLDEDGRDDVLTGASGRGVGAYQAMDGSLFGALNAPCGGPALRHVTFGSVTADQRVDVLVVGTCGLLIYPRDPGHPFPGFGNPVMLLDDGGGSIRRLAVADVDGDGLDDIAALDGSVRLMRQDLTTPGDFLPEATIGSTGSMPAGAVWAQLGGGPSLDLAVVDATGALVVLVDDGQGYQTAYDDDTASDSGGLAVGDLDQSGGLDLVITGSGGVLVYLHQ